MKPSVALERHRVAVREAAGRFRSANPRVFGSAAHGADEEGSDLDILVDALPGATLFELGALQAELEDLLGVPIDLLTPGDLPPKPREAILADSQPIVTAASSRRSRRPAILRRGAAPSFRSPDTEGLSQNLIHSCLPAWAA